MLAALGLALAGLTASLPWTAAQLAEAGAITGAPVVKQGLVPRSTLPAFVVGPTVQLRRAHRREEPPHPPPVAGVPRWLVVPTLHVDAPVVPITTTNGVLLPPSNPQELGWWAAGAEPGAATGGALITGHTVHTGGGAFDHLGTLQRGDRVEVVTTRGRIAYVVSAVAVYRKAALAADAGRVFSQNGPGRLVLITCDDWNGSTYLSNAVVFADPA